MNRFKSILTKDLGWKLFSILAAICMWFVVLNVENPVETKPFSGYVEIQNENAVIDQNKTILNLEEIKETKVNIRIRGKRMTLDRLAQSGGVTAYIDLSSIGENYTGQEAVVPIKVKLPAITGESVSVEYISPPSVTIKTDNLVSKEMDITVVKEGTEQNGYEAGDLKADPEKITVYGPSAEVAKVSEVRVNVDVSTIIADAEKECTPVAYDAEGNPLESVFLSSSTVKVKVNMKKVKLVNIETSISGVTADGYVVKGVTASPDSVYITGEEDVLNKIDSIDIDSVNVFGRTETFTTDVYIANYLPGGVSLKQGSSEKVQLTVKIERQSEKTISFNSSDISVSGYNKDNYSVTLEESTLSMTVCGSEESMEKLNDSDISYEIDLSGLSTGRHSVGVSCKLPDGISIYGDRPVVTVDITENDNSAQNQTQQ